MINPVNVEVITDKLLAFLESTTDEYVPLSFSGPSCPKKKRSASLPAAALKTPSIYNFFLAFVSVQIQFRFITSFPV